jgi:uncharacterized protein YjbI with pentapeptide repeats
VRQLTQSGLGEIDGLEELSDLSFDGLLLAGHDFADRLIEDCSFRGCNLADARFNAATLRRCRFEDATVAGASFFGATFEECKMMGLDFRRGVRFGAPSSARPSSTTRSSGASTSPRWSSRTVR